MCDGSSRATASRQAPPIADAIGADCIAQRVARLPVSASRLERGITVTAIITAVGGNHAPSRRIARVPAIAIKR